MCDNDVGDTDNLLHISLLVISYFVCVIMMFGDIDNLLHTSLLVISCFVCVIMMLMKQTIYYTLPY